MKKRIALLSLIVIALIALIEVNLGLSKKELINKFDASSFKVESEAGGSGTAFFIQNREGEIKLITAKHVCLALQENRSNLIIKGFPIQVYVSKLDPKNDLCELAFPSYLLSTLQITPLKLSEKKLKVFDEIAVGGFPGGAPLTVNMGYYTGNSLVYGPALEEDLTQESCIQKGYKLNFSPLYGYSCIDLKVLDTMTTQVYPGHSGSATVNSKGEVVGVAVMTSPPSYSGIFVSLKDLKEFVNE